VNPVDLVLFDLDDTLLDHTGASRIGLGRHLEAIGIDHDLDEAFVAWHDLEERHYARYLAGQIGFQEQRRDRAREFLSPLGMLLETDDDADAWFSGFVAAVRQAWSLFDDALPCLAAIADRRIGVITNGELDYQRAKLAAVGLDHRVDPVICSGAVGVAKPDPGIFALACEAAGIPADRACYVGDRLETDAIGAAHAGLLGIWLDRPNRATPEQRAHAEREGVPIVRSLAQLPGLLSR